MDRRNFIKAFCAGTAVAVVTPAVIASATTLPSVPPDPNGLTREMLEEIISQLSREHGPHKYIVYTGEEVMKEINKVLGYYVREQQYTGIQGHYDNRTITQKHKPIVSKYGGLYRGMRMSGSSMEYRGQKTICFRPGHLKRHRT